GHKPLEKTKKKISLAIRGEKNGYSKLTNSQVYRIKWIFKNIKPDFDYWIKIAKSLNIKQSTILAIIYNKNWKHIEV
ncbi:MAG: hypothetical protein ACFFC1_06200, partial [Promethearchaeota archaeon]